MGGEGVFFLYLFFSALVNATAKDMLVSTSMNGSPGLMYSGVSIGSSVVEVLDCVVVVVGSVVVVTTSIVVVLDCMHAESWQVPPGHGVSSGSAAYTHMLLTHTSAVHGFASSHPCGQPPGSVVVVVGAVVVVKDGSVVVVVVEVVGTATQSASELHSSIPPPGTLMQINPIHSLCAPICPAAAEDKTNNTPINKVVLLVFIVSYNFFYMHKKRNK